MTDFGKYGTNERDFAQDKVRVSKTAEAGLIFGQPVSLEIAS